MDVRSFGRSLYNRAADRWLGIRSTEEAVEHLAAPSDRSALLYQDPIRYVPTDYLVLWTVLRSVRLSARDVLFDIGCGAGRALCLAARSPVARCVGIEFDERLAAMARANREALKKPAAPIEIRVEDAARADYAGGTVFYLYNPFGERTMAAVIDAIAHSVAATPRDIRIVYAKPDCESLLAASSWLEKYGTLRPPFARASVSLWRNRGRASGAAA